MRPERLPDNYYYGGGGDTALSAPALGIFLVCSLLILVLPRKHILAPLLLAALLIPLGNVIVVLGMHWMLSRCLVLIAWARVLRDYIRDPEAVLLERLTSVDRCLVAWALSNAVMYVVNWQTYGAVVTRLGFLYTTLAGYFLMRVLIRTLDDIRYSLRVLAVICVLIAPFMLIERLNGANYYLSFFGGGTQVLALRDGKIRAEGPFAHPIIAGTLGAMLLPLFIELWQRHYRDRLLVGLGAVAAAVMTITSNSGTPANTATAGMVALFAWPLRKRMREVRWAGLAALVALQFAMNANVWFLIARVGSLSGGGAWHRANLVDQCIRHFGDWWLCGTQDNWSWGLDMWDVDNAYVGAAFAGGLLPLLLLVAMLASAFRLLGKTRRLVAGTTTHERFVWAVGATLFANTVAFFGIVYFDQSTNVWYVVLAIISALAICAEQQSELSLPQPRPTYDEYFWSHA